MTRARLVLLNPEHAYSKGDNPALAEAKAILESRGSAPRVYRNSLVFLAADATRLRELEQAAAGYLAWKGIDDERDQLGLVLRFLGLA